MSSAWGLWVVIVAAGAVAWFTKAAGHRVPDRWLENPRVLRIASYLTVALLSALFAVQAFTSGRSLAFDARVAAVAVAAVLLWRRAPFIVVVIAAAIVAAALRAAGWS